MSKLLLLIALIATMAAVAGCSRKNKPVNLPPGATLEVYAIAAAEAPDTTPATDPATGQPLFLQTPPIVTTADVDTITLTEIDIHTATGPPSNRTQPALNVDLTAAGAKKMAQATANPTGKPIAVVVNGQVVATPTMIAPIQNGAFQISGDSHVTAAIERLARP